MYSGIDGLIVENMNDTPYVKSKMLGPEVIAAMTATSSAVRSILPQEKPVGIQILAGANCEALAVAKGNTIDILSNARSSSLTNILSNMHDFKNTKFLLIQCFKYLTSLVASVHTSRKLRIFSCCRRRFNARCFCRSITSVQVIAFVPTFLLPCYYS